jgi:tight adherence protein C
MAEHIQELEQVAAIATVIAQALRAGNSVSTSIALALADAKGPLAQSLRYRLARIELGESLSKALEPNRDDPPSLGELLEKLRLTGRLGTAVAEQIDESVSTWRARSDSLLAQMAIKAESRMLVPLVFLILPVTVIFALYPSLQLLNLEGI